MGLFKMSTGETPRLGEPQPHRYNIVEMHEVNGWTVALVHYEGVPLFMGNKILVFEGERVMELEQAEVLDPHFLEQGALVPMVRFRADDAGLALAFRFCEAVAP